MIGPLPLSDRRGKFADVVAHEDGWLVPCRIEGGPLMVVWVRIDDATAQIHLDAEMIDTGMDDNTFPRVMSGFSRTWLAYRAMRGGLAQAVLRTVVGQSLGPERWLGPAGGNSPVCLSSEWMAWQDVPAGVVRGLKLDTGEARVLRTETRPTGLSRLEGDRVIFIDEDRARVAGMSNPVTAGGCTVGEGPDGGMAVQMGTARALFLAGDCFVPRVAVRKAHEFAAVTWGGPGVRMVLFTAEDVAAATTNQPPGKPPTEPPAKPPANPAPTRKEHTMIAYAGPVPGFLPGTLEPHPDGDGVLIRKPNGKIVACTPDGHLEERDAAGGWEKFRKGKSSLIAERGDRLFVLSLAE